MAKKAEPKNKEQRNSKLRRDPVEPPHTLEPVDEEGKVVNVSVNCCCCEKHDEGRETKLEPHMHTCVPLKCCCKFRILLTRVDVVAQDKFDGKAELQLTGYANGIYATFPSPSTWFHHHKNWGLKTINLPITTIKVEEGKEAHVHVWATGMEVDIAGGGTPELGTSENAQMILKCDSDPLRVWVTLDFHRLKQGVFSGDPKIAVRVEFAAFQEGPCCFTCCCPC